KPRWHHTSGAATRRLFGLLGVLIDRRRQKQATFASGSPDAVSLLDLNRQLWTPEMGYLGSCPPNIRNPRIPKTLLGQSWLSPSLGSKLPDRFDSRRTDSLVSGDEGQAQVHGGRRDDPIGHIRDYIAGHFVYRLSHVFIHCLKRGGRKRCVSSQPPNGARLPRATALVRQDRWSQRKRLRRHRQVCLLPQCV